MVQCIFNAKRLVVVGLFTVLALVFFSGSAAGQDDLLLLFPKVQSNSSTDVGIAIANDSSKSAQIFIWFFEYNGITPFPTQTRVVGPHEQFSETLVGLFGEQVREREGFILAQSNNMAVMGFFLTFTPGVLRIDGAEAIVVSTFEDTFVFPELFFGDDEVTRFNVVVFNAVSTEVQFELIRNGAVVETSTQIILPGPEQFAALSMSAEEIFSGPILEDSYVRVTCPQMLAAYQEFGTENVLGGRNGLEVSRSQRVPFSLFGAQAAHTSAISTQLTVINPGTLDASLTISAFPTGAPATAGGAERQANALEASATKQVDLSPLGIIRSDLAELMGLDERFEGWLRIDSDVTGIVGNVTFGDSGGIFLSSVQLQASPVSDFVFSHVADGLGFFTGITFLNILPDPIEVTMDVFRGSGTQTGSATFELEGFEHRPDLLTQFVEGLQPQVEGFIRVRAPMGVMSFELFGFTPPGKGLVALSAVPPQRGNGTFSGQITTAQFSSTSLLTGKQFQLPAPLPIRTYPASSAKNVTLRLEDDFRPGEVIVKYRSGFSAQAALSSESSLRTLQSAPDQVHLMRAQSIGTPAPAALATLSVGDLVDLKRSTLDLIEELNRDPNVVYAQPNYIYQATSTPNDTLFPSQWHYAQMNLEAVWDITKGSSDVVVAVIDTGSKFGHPDLGPRLNNDGYDFISDPQTALDGDGIDNDPEDPGDDPSGTISSYHGTHVAGTVGAATNNAMGVAGVNWVSPIMTLRVLGAGGGSSFDVAQAIYYSVGLPNTSNTLPAKVAQVINMSLGGPGGGPTEAAAVQAALVQGAIVVAAAGNSNSTADHFPSGFPGVFSIGAIDQSLGKAPYSNYGPSQDFMAPGGNTGVDLDGDGNPDGVRSTLWNQQQDQPSYAFYQGTSMATPHVAGVISLMLSVNQNLTREQIELILQETAIDLGTPGWDDIFGHGLVNALAAVAEAAEISFTDPVLVVNPVTLNFGNSRNEMDAKLINGGGGSLTNVSSTVETDSGGNWLSAQITQGTPHSTLTVTVDRNGVPDGEFSGRVRITSSGGDATVEVEMLAGFQDGDDICGELQGGEPCLFVLAIDPRTFNVISQGIATFEGLDGNEETPSDKYSYRSLVTPAGSYLIIAGTDVDRDNFICDEGELCGAFPVSNQANPISILSGEDTAGISFTVEEGGSSGLAGSGDSRTEPDRQWSVDKHIQLKQLKEWLKKRLEESGE
jgi:serine protease